MATAGTTALKRPALFLALFALLGAGCAPREAQLPEAPAIAGEPVLAEYRLQPGDRIEFRHRLDATYDGVVIVAPDGRIAVPGIRHPINAAGLTAPMLSQALYKGYRADDVLRAPDFTLSIVGFGDTRIYIGGEVGKPGAYNLGSGRRTIVQAIVAASGPLATASLSKVAVLRVLEDGRVVLIPTDVSKVLNGSDLSANIPLQPRDVVIVPKSNVASLDDWVYQYIRLALPVPVSVLLDFSNGNYIFH